ncbi:MAG: response regulator [Deltaproteobacteria bacterium]|nr:MAG: response regulator [Deltaproteobacteria bacterium]
MAQVLVIDDDEAIRTLIREALEAIGHGVREAANGKQGMRVFREHGADLVITNIFMPEQEGIETITELQEEEFPPPIVAISGGGTVGHAEVLEEAKLFGATATLAKPFSLADLHRTVAAVLDGGDQATP